MTETAPVGLLAAETIFRRTRTGQREVVFDRLRIAGPARRLLWTVTGYTPLRNLIDLQAEADSAAAAVQALLDKNLIEPV